MDAKHEESTDRHARGGSSKLRRNLRALFVGSLLVGGALSTLISGCAAAGIVP